jgi:hypothetical protein
MRQKRPNISRGKHRTPRFKSIEEESAFWDRHDPLDYGTWEEIPYDQFLRECGRRSARKVSLTLRVEPELVLKLKQTARKYRLKYQVLVRELLWRNLSRLAQ